MTLIFKSKEEEQEVKPPPKLSFISKGTGIDKSAPYSMMPSGRADELRKESVSSAVSLAETGKRKSPLVFKSRVELPSKPKEDFMPHTLANVGETIVGGVKSLITGIPKAIPEAHAMVKGIAEQIPYMGETLSDYEETKKEIKEFKPVDAYKAWGFNVPEDMIKDYDKNGVPLGENGNYLVVPPAKMTQGFTRDNIFKHILAPKVPKAGDPEFETFNNSLAYHEANTEVGIKSFFKGLTLGTDVSDRFLTGQSGAQEFLGKKVLGQTDEEYRARFPEATTREATIYPEIQGISEMGGQFGKYAILYGALSPAIEASIASKGWLSGLKGASKTLAQEFIKDLYISTPMSLMEGSLTGLKGKELTEYIGTQMGMDLIMNNVMMLGGDYLKSISGKQALDNIKSLITEDAVGKSDVSKVVELKDNLKTIGEELPKGAETEGATKAVNTAVEKIDKIIDMSPTDEIQMDNFKINKEGDIILNIPEGTKPRKFIYNSIYQAPVVPGEVKKGTPQTYYKPLSNVVTLDKATARVNADHKLALYEWDAMGAVKSADDVALGEALMIDAIKKGNTELATKMGLDLAERGTASGQTTQMFSALKRLTPEGMLMYAQRKIMKANAELKEKFNTKKYNKKKIELTPADSKKILDLTKKAVEISETNPEVSKRIFAQAEKVIQDLMPVSTSQKFAALIRVSLLGNVRTQGTNIGGNMSTFSAHQVAYYPAGAVDFVAGLFTGERFYTMNPWKRMGLIFDATKGFEEGWKNWAMDIKYGVYTDAMGGKYGMSPQDSFSNKNVVGWVLNKYDTAIKRGLGLGDKPFKTASKNMRLAEMLDLRGYKNMTYGQAVKLRVGEFIQSKANLEKLQNEGSSVKQIDIAKDVLVEADARIVDLEKIYKIAEADAKEIVYQDKNRVTNAFSNLKKVFNLDYEIGPGTTQLVFTQVPGNLVRMGFRFSPLEIIELGGLIINGIKKGEFNQATFSKNAGRFLTGSAITYLGLRLAKEGLLRSQASDNASEQALEYAMGITPGSIKMEDKWVNYSNIEPFAFALGFGGELADMGVEEKDFIDCMEGGLNVFLDQGIMSGISRTFSGYSPSGSIIDAMIKSSTVFAPTIAGQVADFNDDVYRDVSADSTIQHVVNTFMKKIPGLREDLPAKLDIYGNPSKTYTGADSDLDKFLQAFISPIRFSKQGEDNITMELFRLAEETKKFDHVPYPAPDTITVNKQEIDLTEEQEREFLKAQGDLFRESFVNELLNSTKFNYEEMSAEEQQISVATLLNKVRTATIAEYKEDNREKIIKQIIGGE